MKNLGLITISLFILSACGQARPVQPTTFNVQDAAGNPVSGVKIQMSSEEYGYEERHETDENGNADFILPPSDDIEGRLEKDGVESEIDNPREGGRIEFDDDERSDGEREEGDDSGSNDETDDEAGEDGESSDGSDNDDSGEEIDRVPYNNVD